LSPLLLVVSLAQVIACEPQAPTQTQSTGTPSSAGAEPASEEPIGMPSVGDPAGTAASAQPTAQNNAEIEFDPDKPPPGYINCQRNHCHKKGGGVASYQQVMQEMGATRIKGQGAMPEMPPAPADVAGPPADAERTPSGLASKVLSPGTGTTRPGPTSRVTVHY